MHILKILVRVVRRPASSRSRLGGFLGAVFAALSMSFTSAEAEKLRVGLGYLPDVQFAPFYAAEKAGLFAKRGLEVEFQHGFTSELYPLLAAGKLDFVVGDAEDAVILRARPTSPLPVRYLMALYQSVPNALFSRAELGIRSVRDLKGKTIGVPGLFGTSLTSLQAMLRAAGLKETDVRIQQIGFTQVEAIQSGRVDVAMGFINNEPLVLESRGIKLNIIRASAYNPSAGNGVMALDDTLKNAGLVSRFLAACQEGMALTLRSPKTAFEQARSFVPNLAADRFRVLETSLPLYQSAFSRVQGLGFSNPTGWSRMLELLRTTGRVQTNLPPSAFFTNTFLQPHVQANAQLDTQALPIR